MTAEQIEALLALVERAGQAILPYWRSGVAVQEKADASPVTAADMAAHRILSEGLVQLFPEVPVLSEEAANIPLNERGQWQRWWLVDPLDGTKEFIADSEEFTVNVALVEAGVVRFGVVGVPARGLCYYGGAGLGAWRREVDGRRVALQVRDRAPDALQVVASRRHSSPEQERLLAGLEQALGPVERVSVGSSLKFCLLAEAAADFYPRLAPTSQWDTAAAQGVLEGAGGVVLDLHGEPLRYPMQESLLNPFFLALPENALWRSALQPLLESAAH